MLDGTIFTPSFMQIIISVLKLTGRHRHKGMIILRVALSLKEHNIWGREVHTGFWLGQLREIDHLEDLGIMGG
jgi:hypothetical protein